MLNWTIQVIQMILLNLTQTQEYTFKNKTQFQFLSKYNPNDTDNLISIPKLEPTDVDCKFMGGSLFELDIFKKDLFTLIQQLKSTILYIMTNYKFVDSSRTAHKIIKQLESGISIDSIHEFSNYDYNFVNMIKTIPDFVIYGHPFVVLLNLFFNNSVEKNINKFTSPQYCSFYQMLIIYNQYLKPLLFIYVDFYNVYAQNSDCSCTYDQNGHQTQISDINKLQINDIHHSLFDDVNKLCNKILNGSNENSYQLFLSSFDMYNNFVNDYKQYNILLNGLKLIYLNRTNADKILEDLLNGKIDITNENDKNKQLKQIALVLMIIVINGRGLKSNSIFDLYGMQTRANSVSDDGNLCIYNTKRINDINSNIRSFIENKIIQIEAQPSWKIGDFSEKNFTTTIFNYKNEKKEIYKNMTDKFYEEFNGLKDYILNYVDLKKLSDIKSIMSKLATFNITKFRDLYNYYEKMNDSENKMNEIEKLSNLAKFYQTTKNMLENGKIQGIKVNKYDSNELSISEIRIEIP